MYFSGTGNNGNGTTGVAPLPFSSMCHILPDTVTVGNVAPADNCDAGIRIFPPVGFASGSLIVGPSRSGSERMTYNSVH